MEIQFYMVIFSCYLLSTGGGVKHIYEWAKGLLELETRCFPVPSKGSLQGHSRSTTLTRSKLV